MASNRFANTLGRLAHALQGPSRRELEERYLAGSVSHADVERRMREIERGRFSAF